jgi:hypothetical protein
MMMDDDDECGTVGGILDRGNRSSRKKPALGQQFLRDLTEYVFPSSQLRTETDPVVETLCFLLFRTLDDGQSPETQ